MGVKRPEGLEEHRPLAPLTTLELGGPARYFLEVHSVQEASEAIVWAREQGLEILALGGGSNLLVSDEGFDGLVLHVAIPGCRFSPPGPWPEGDIVHVDLGAGEDWDDMVQKTVGAGLAGVECLSGIPGRVGAAPVQNIGAYGQELEQTLVEVTGLCMETGAPRRFNHEECDFAYRSSRFKGADKGRWLIVGLRLALRRGSPAPPRYAELARRSAGNEGERSLASVRETVLELRRGKSMVWDERDPNRRSAGSFFLNPIVDDNQLKLIEQRSDELGAGTPPRWPLGQGKTKLSAAWLIEKSGFPRGSHKGPVGQSSAHALALINKGGATAQELWAYASEVRKGVQEMFGVELTPEPVTIGLSNLN